MIGRHSLLLLTGTLLLAGCAESFTAFHSQTGDPILLGRRSYSYDGCLSTMREEADRLGVTLRYVKVRGSIFGRSLLWPFEPGYACEAAIGPEQPPNGIYLNVPPLSPQG
jgi:hypothetical protein